LRDGDLTFHTAKKHQHKTNTSRRHISLEIEIARDGGNGADYVLPVAEKWDDPIVEDGSLPDSGYEINTNPSSGDVFIKHITELCTALSEAEAHVDRSCGMHCHVSASDYSYFDLFKLCRLYTLIEDGMFSCVAPSRRNNRYAKRCADAYRFGHYTTFKNDIIAALYGDDALRLRPSWDNTKGKPSTRYHRGKNRLAPMAEKYGQERYNALNLHSFFYRGTVEFRHHQGSTQAHKATRWGMLCAAVLDAAQRMTLAEIDALGYLTNPFNRLLCILPEPLKVWADERRSQLHYGGE
jgi:hypothetical protein